MPAALAAPLAVAALTVLLGLPTLVLPLHPDQALFALIGQAIGQGEFPYADAWDNKSPSVFFVYALAVRGPFDLMRDVRVFDLAWTAVTAAALVELGRRWWTPRAGVIAGTVYALATETGNPWAQSAQPDSLLALPLVLALLLYDAAKGRRAWLIAVGALLGFAFQLRFFIALLIPFLPLVELLGVPARHRTRLWLGRMAWLGAGFIAFQVAVALYLAAGAALLEYLRTLQYAAWYTRQGGPWNPPDGPTLGAFLNAVRLNFWRWALARVALTLPALAGGFCGAVILRERRVAQVLLFAVLCYAGVAAQAKFFWYHFGVLVPLLALLGGWTWDTLLRLARRAQPPLVTYGATLAVAFALVLGSPELWDNGKRDWINYVNYYRRPEERDAYLNSFSAYVERQRVAEYLRGRTREGDLIYVWGFDPFLYLLSGRESASRFLVSFPLMSDWAPASWRPSFLAELERRPPRYFVVQRGHAGSWVVGRDRDMADAVGEVPALQTWLAANYELETEMDFRIIYRRRE